MLWWLMRVYWLNDDVGCLMGKELLFEKYGPNVTSLVERGNKLLG